MSIDFILFGLAALIAVLLGILASRVPADKTLCPIAYGSSWCGVAGMLLMALKVDSIPSQLIGFALLGLGVAGLTIRFANGGKYYVPR